MRTITEIILVLLVGVLLWACVGMYFEKIQPEELPTFWDVQQMLVDRGHDIKVDGKMCKGWNMPEHSETLKAWDAEICKDSAAQWDGMYEVRK